MMIFSFLYFIDIFYRFQNYFAVGANFLLANSNRKQLRVVIGSAGGHPRCTAA
jgi:hypothetical protein